MLAIEDLTRQFGASRAVDRVSLAIDRPMMIDVIGRSGAGKSTLLRMINRLTEPSGGRVLFEGRDVTSLRGSERRAWQAQCAMIFQQFNLVPRLDVVSNVLHGTLNRHGTMAMLFCAFGPGPPTGTLAVMVTDTGTFGKLFSEALENVDGRQVEGVASTGARPLQRWCFGIIPQLVPVLASQVLYMFESNVRSSTIIGAITGGGIGLLLTQAMQTGKDWEDATCCVLLILGMVFLPDALSGRIRRRIILGPVG